MMQYQFVHVEPDRLRVEFENVAEAKLALKELKLMKKECNLAKRNMNEQKSAVRAQYTENVRTQGSKMLGGGGFGRFVRTMQTISREHQRAALARALAPLEKDKQKIEALARAVEMSILNCEAFILRGGE
jgi:hypothetical protein